MSEWVDITCYTVCGAMMSMMALGIMFSAFMPSLDKWSRRFFISLFSMLLLSTATLFVDMFIYKLPGMLTAENIIIFFEFVTVSTIMPMPTILLLHWCGESIKGSKLFRSVIALWGVFIIILIVAQFSDLFYFNRYVDSVVLLFRGQYFIFLPLPLFLIMVLNIAGVVRRKKKLSKKYYFAVLTYLLPMTIALFVYLFNYLAIYIVFCMAIFAITMFSLILSDSMDQYMRHQREIANQRADIMVLQMRPHFICNTMISVSYLCKQDPDKAQKVTLDFTDYLRRNFTAIASEDTISFNDELEHTRAYLAVEQAQHEDNLFVSFDTPHTNFCLPPLTLQPIVENAVKHGMQESDGPIHISVITGKKSTGSEIIVEDDGVGIKASDERKPHIALNNIKERLEIMCRGSLTVVPREGGGTTVTIFIPTDKNTS